VVPDRRHHPPQLCEGATCTGQVRLAGCSCLVKPDDAAVVEAVEGLVAQLEGDDRYWFHFLLFQPGRNTCSHSFDPVGKVKSWIVKSRRVFTDHWRDAEAVVLSYRGKKTLRLNVVLKDSDQAYSLDVSLRTGAMSWRELNTKQAAELKEALKVAQR